MAAPLLGNAGTNGWDAINQASLKYAANYSDVRPEPKDHVITYGEYKLAVRTAALGLNDLVSSFNDVGGASSDVENKLKSLISQKLANIRPVGLTGGMLGGVGGDTFDEAYKRLAAVALQPEELQIPRKIGLTHSEQAGLTGLSPGCAGEARRLLDKGLQQGLD